MTLGYVKALQRLTGEDIELWQQATADLNRHETVLTSGILP